MGSTSNRWKYKWNAQGMLQEVTRPDGEKVSYQYDALGRRLSKKFKNTTTKWLWNGNVPLHEWKENYELTFKDGYEQKVIRKHQETTWVFEENSFVPTAKIKNKKKFSILADHLGTPTQMYDEEGVQVWERSLDMNGRVVTGDNNACPFTFQGQVYDKDIELTYNRFRWYSSDDGRYISVDPLELHSGENNFYAYVNDVNSEIDPKGLSKTYAKKKPAHGNSKNSKKKNHVYVIYNNKNGKVYKYGISGGKKTQHDTPESYRANSQKRKIAEAEGIDVDDISTKIEVDDISRVDALDVEQAKVDDFYSKNDRPPKYNKRPKPTALR